MHTFDNTSLDRWLFSLFRNGGSFDFHSSAAREAQSRVKREQARKQRSKMKAHNKRQRRMNKQHGRRAA